MESPLRHLGISTMNPLAKQWLFLVVANSACAVLNLYFAFGIDGIDWTTPINLLAAVIAVGGAVFSYGQHCKYNAKGT